MITREFYNLTRIILYSGENITFLWLLSLQPQRTILYFYIGFPTSCFGPCIFQRFRCCNLVRHSLHAQHSHRRCGILRPTGREIPLVGCLLPRFHVYCIPHFGFCHCSWFHSSSFRWNFYTITHINLSSLFLRILYLTRRFSTVLNA